MAQASGNHVFMSYSRKDEKVMRQITRFLRSEGIKVWVDNEKLTPGTPIWEAELENAIIGASAIVVLLSPDSKEADWVRREISYAGEYRKRIFPVLVRGNRDSSVPIRLITNQLVNIEVDESRGFKELSTALRAYLKEVEAEERKAQEEAEKLRRAQEESQVRTEALRQKVAQEVAERALRETKEKEALEEAERKRKEQERQAERIVKAERVAREQKKEHRPEPRRTDAGQRLEFFVKREEERVADVKENQQKWIATGLISLGWAIGWAVGWATDSAFRLPETQWITAYAIGGFFTALSLRRLHILSDWTKVLWMTLGGHSAG